VAVFVEPFFQSGKSHAPGTSRWSSKVFSDKSVNTDAGSPSKVATEQVSENRVTEEGFFGAVIFIHEFS
jgi:hypothetical protein